MTLVYIYTILLTMSKENRSKLNQLLYDNPKDIVLTSNYLFKQGFSYELIHRYKKSNWLTQIDRGAYILTGNKVDWKGALFSCQKQLSLNIYAGGKTALQLKGLAHYLSNKSQTVYLFGSQGIKLPHWFNYFKSRFNILYSTTNLFPKQSKKSLSDYSFHQFSIEISAPERAALELAYHIPKHVSLQETSLIFENLTTLQSPIVQKLLEICSSIKAKRIFLFLAEKNQHLWFKHINIKTINLGKGKRVIEENGVLDKTYDITVPKTLQ